MRNFLKDSAPPFQCPLAPFVQQLSPAFGHTTDLEFFPEGLFLSSKVKASAFFNASVETLDRWIAKGLVKPYKRGRVYFFPVEGLALAMKQPRIISFIKRKKLLTTSFKRRKTATGNEVKYRLLPAPGGNLFVRIRYRGINIVWFCQPSVVEDKKELENSISDVINLYIKCHPVNSWSYERN